MPYIKKETRLALSSDKRIPDTPGELNYCFTKLCIDYLAIRNESYQTYNDIIGALECCKQEVYRRLISKYEDKKINENSDVFPSS